MMNEYQNGSLKVTNKSILVVDDDKDIFQTIKGNKEIENPEYIVTIAGVGYKFQSG